MSVSDDVASSFDARLEAALGRRPADDERLAVAVSGGVDSMALLRLAAETYPGRVVALTVDHGLRPASAEEAEWVSDEMAGLGIPHRTLRWTGDKPGTNIHAAAREARYRLLLEACATEGAALLLTAHHLDDQAETFLMRLNRGSGVRGLAGVRAKETRNGLTIVRPLLGIRKAELVRWLSARGQSWIDDPSNDDPRFDRSRIRAALAEQSFLDVARIADSARFVAAADEALDHVTRLHLHAHATALREGYLRLAPGFFETHDEILRRALLAAFQLLGCSAIPRREEMLGFARRQSGTLAGCRLLASNGCHLLLREPGRSPPAIEVAAGEAARFDRRFDISVSDAGRVQLLGEAGWQQLAERWPEAKEHTLPHPVRLGLPSLWRGGELCAVPHLGVHEDRLAATFRPEPNRLFPAGLFLS